MSTFGAGGSPAGSSDAGYGSVDAAIIPSHDLLKSPNGPGRLDARRIDPVTRDYVVGSTGSLAGMTRAQQVVELAFLTLLGSSTIANIGNDLNSIATITDSFAGEVTAKITSALSFAVNTGLIEIVGIDVTRHGKTGAFIRTRWRDLSTGEEQDRVI